MKSTHPGWIAGITWLFQVAIAVLLLQTLFFKLTYAPQTQVIFESIGGRPAATLTAFAELVAAVLLLVPAGWLTRIDPSCACSAREIRGWTDFKGWVGYASALGAAFSLMVIGGAIATHLLILGIVIPIAPGSIETDGGTLFALALAIAAMAATVTWFRRRELNAFGHAVLNQLPSHKLAAA